MTTKDVNEKVPEKRRYVVFPWKTSAEFHEVSECIYNSKKDSNHITFLQRALDKMYVWRLRRSYLTPAGVLATITILEVQVKDMKGRLEEDVLESLYAHAIMRFLNFMSSTLQKHNIRSMYDIAKELGLSSFIVDVRHACAHGVNLPSLNLLRSTAAECMEWLRDYYWAKTFDILCDAEAHNEADEADEDKAYIELSNLINLYDNYLETNEKVCEKFDIKCESFQNIKIQLDEYIKMVISWLKNNEINNAVIEKLLMMKLFQRIPKLGASLRKLIELTRSFFYMLSSYNIIHKLFNRILKMAENQNETLELSICAAYGFWSEKIAEGFLAVLKCKRFHNDELKQYPNLQQINFSLIYTTKLCKKFCELMLKTGNDIEQTLVFGDIRHYPWVWLCEHDFVEYHILRVNEYTKKACVIMVKLCNPALKAKKRYELVKLINIYMGNNEDLTDSESESDDEKYAVAFDEFRKMILEVLNKQNKSNTNTNS